MHRIKVVAFDLGDTLVEYEGLPLSWEEHYVDALSNLSRLLSVAPNQESLAGSCAVLRRFNTRLNPRSHEVTFAEILKELQPCLGMTSAVDEGPAARAFFQPFRQRLRCFPETAAALHRLRAEGFKIGVFTDVPYGMPREFVVQDIDETALTSYIDILHTSRDSGFRKPAPETLRRLAEAFSATAVEMVYIGNERKDIEVAKAFGCHSILVDRANVRPPWGQDHTIHSLAELGAMGTASLL